MMMVTGVLCLLFGSLISLTAALGVLRLPDFFLRMHAATKAGVAGAGFVMIGVGFHVGTLSVWIKVVIAMFFLLLTTPIAGHLLGRAGYVAGVPLWRGTTEDALRGVLPRGRFDHEPGGDRAQIAREGRRHDA
jgi:monovalent cation/proton antiporter MnhG/PhaG subunit